MHNIKGFFYTALIFIKLTQNTFYGVLNKKTNTVWCLLFYGTDTQNGTGLKT